MRSSEKTQISMQPQSLVTTAAWVLLWLGSNVACFAEDFAAYLTPLNARVMQIDEKGLGRVRRFFLWHLRFWHRWRPYTRDDFEAARPNSLLQQREPEVTDDPEAVLLAGSDEADHERIWSRLLDRDHPGA